jgi:hypothetical protein
MTKLVFITTPPPHPARANAVRAIQEAPDGVVVTIQPPKRTLAANAKMWALLTEVSLQVEWYGRHLTPTEWKFVFSSQLKKQEVVPNLDGTGFVVLGQSTSEMSSQEIGDLIELIYAFGAEREVKFMDDPTTPKSHPDPNEGVPV